MKREEIQKLIAEAFDLGCNQGRGEYYISDYCTSASQEESVCYELNKEQDEFTKRTGFALR